MRNKIESRFGKHSGERNSSSSTEIKKEDKYVDKKEYNHKHKKHYSVRIDYNKKRKSRSSSRSNSDSESDNEHLTRHRKHLSKKDKNSKDSVYGSIKIKEEPITDNEHKRHSNKYENGVSNHRRYENGHRGRRSRSRSRSRSWNNDRRPIKHERLSDGNNEKRPIKKERFSDLEKEPRWGKQNELSVGQDKKKPLVDKAKPDFGLSGKLTEETNTYNGVVIKYSEPPEARKPKRRWRLYPFKGDEGLPTLYIHRQSAFLIGRDRKIADLPVDHPSCSKQHAVLQYRLVPFERSDGTKGKKICPYIIDLESANGTFVNNVRIDPKKYVQLIEKDVIKFAFSSREYVLLHEHSKDSEDDDDLS